MNNKLIRSVVGIAIGVILLGSVLSPVLADSEDQLKTTFNNGLGGYIQDGMDNYEFVTNPNLKLYAINGEIVDVSPWGAFTVLYTDQCRIVTAGHFVQVFSADNTRQWNLSGSAHLQKFTYLADTKTLTCVAYEGLTEDSGISQTISFVVENIVYRIPGGDYTEIHPGDQGFYVNDVSQILAGGVYTTGSLVTPYFAEGSSVYVKSGYSAENEIDSINVEGYKNLVKCDSYTITVSDGSTSESFVPYSVFVPAEVQASTPIAENAQNLLSIIPVFFVLALLLCAVAVIRTRD